MGVMCWYEVKSIGLLGVICIDYDLLLLDSTLEMSVPFLNIQRSGLPCESLFLHQTIESFRKMYAPIHYSGTNFIIVWVG